MLGAIFEGKPVKMPAVSSQGPAKCSAGPEKPAPLEAARLFGLRRSSISRLILQANSGISASGVIEPVFTVSNNHMILDWPFGPKIIPAFGPVLSERRLAVGSEDRACMI